MEGLDSLEEISPVLTDEYISEKLSLWFQESIVYEGYKFVDSTGKGDSYMSDVIRIMIYGNKTSNTRPPTVQVQVILKSLPKNVARRKSFRAMEFFKNEVAFYDKVLPELLKFQAEKKVPDEFDHCPRIFALHSDGTNDIVILEDLTIYGYGGPKRQKGIDYEHCEIIINTLAKYHALSMAFKNQNREKFDEITSHIFEVYYDTKNWNWYKRFWKRLCICAIDAVEKEYPNSIYSEKIKDFASEKTFEKMVDAACNTTKYGLIGHGDMWTNNFLVKYTDVLKPVHGKLIDFQLVRHATPILDLSFFIYACTEKDIRTKYYDTMLKLYHDKLSSQMKDLGSDPKELYPWHVFMDEVKKYSFFGLGFSLESTPFIVLAPEDAIEVNHIKGTEAMNIADIWKIGPYKNLEGRLRAADNVVHAVDMGYI